MNIRSIHVAFLLSVLIHIAAMWVWQPQLHLALEPRPPLDRSGPLQLRLEPEARQAVPPPVPAPQTRERTPDAPVIAPPPKPPTAKPKPRPVPPVRAAKPKPAPPPMTKPAAPSAAPDYPVPKPRPAPAPAPAPKPETAAPAPEPPPEAAPGGDLSSYIASRRRARQQSEPLPARPPSPAQESEDARANRIAEANLGVGRTPKFGQEVTGGGIFQISRVGYDYAEYLFYGWNPDIRRNSTQLITVRKGLYPDIRKAVVRSMIDIIRRHEQGEFLWESRRLGRNVTLSARPMDDAGLEEFLMKEFFD